MFNAFRVQSLEFLRYLSSSFVNFLFYSKKIKDRERIKKILIVKTDYLGDLAVATGVFSSLRESFPEAETVLLTNSQMASVFSGDGNLDGVIVYDPKFFCKRAGKSYSLVKNLPLLRELRREGFDLIVDLSSDLFTILLALSYIFRAYRAERDTLRTKDTLKKYWTLLLGGVRRDIKMGHEVSRNCQILEKVGVERSNAGLYFPLRTENREEAKRFAETHGLDAFVVLQPGSYWEIRRWAPEKFARLADEIIDRYNLQVVLCGNGAEAGLLRRIKIFMRGRAIIQAGELSLVGFAALIEQAQLFVGNDSGPTHVAAALGVPTVALMGTADIERYRPYGPNSEICYRPVRCGPCYAGDCYMPENICLQPVEVDQVLEKVDKLLKVRRGIGLAKN